MHSLPGPDFFVAITALIPLLLIAVAVERRADEASADGSPVLDVVTYAFAAIGEVAAFSALGSEHVTKFEYSVALDGTAVMWAALLYQLLSPYLERARNRTETIVVGIIGLIAILTPIVVALASQIEHHYLF